MTIVTDDSEVQTEEVTTEEVETETQTDNAAELEEANKATEEAKAEAEKATNEAKMWKGRLTKAQKAAAGEEESTEEVKDVPVTQESLVQLEWKLKNEPRISLVQEEYDKILSEGYKGETVSPVLALELAEKEAKIDNVQRDRQADMSTTSVTNRGVAEDDYEPTAAEKRDGITKEMKKKHFKAVQDMRKMRGQ